MTFIALKQSNKSRFIANEELMQGESFNNSANCDGSCLAPAVHRHIADSHPGNTVADTTKRCFLASYEVTKHLHHLLSALASIVVEAIQWLIIEILIGCIAVARRWSRRLIRTEVLLLWNDLLLTR